MNTATDHLETEAAANKGGGLHIQGVLWRKYLDYAVKHVPLHLEPVLIAYLATFFFLATPSWRRRLEKNLRLVFPKAGALSLFFKSWRVYHNFAWSLVDTARFHQGQAEFDWEFEGFEEFKELADPKRSAVIVTAHMASYDLGVYIFRQKIGHNITMVRAPEPDQRTQEYVHSHSEPSGVHVSYSGSDELISLELVHNLRRGGVVAIQGDRAIPGLSSVKASWFGNPVRLPAGPFALAMVTGAPIFPLFIARTGIRRYRVITFPPIRVTRTSEDRTKDWEKAAAEWSEAFESILRRHWHQWFAFEGNSRNQDDGTH